MVKLASRRAVIRLGVIGAGLAFDRLHWPVLQKMPGRFRVTAVASRTRKRSETVAQTCKTLRDEGNKILANQMPDIKARVESTLSKIKMNEARFLGVLAEDSNACYAGLVQKIHTEAGTDKTQITVFAITIIKEKSVFSYRFAVYHSAQTADMLLGRVRNEVTSLMAANGIGGPVDRGNSGNSLPSSRK